MKKLIFSALSLVIMGSALAQTTSTTYTVVASAASNVMQGAQLNSGFTVAPVGGDVVIALENNCDIKVAAGQAFVLSAAEISTFCTGLIQRNIALGTVGAAGLLLAISPR